MGYKIAIVGATGNVGHELLDILDERDFPADEVIAVASRRSQGRRNQYRRAGRRSCRLRRCRGNRATGANPRLRRRNRIPLAGCAQEPYCRGESKSTLLQRMVRREAGSKVTEQTISVRQMRSRPPRQ